MDPPPPQTLISALNGLYVLGALDDEGLLTRLGRKMAEFPLEPQLAKVLLTSVDLGCSDEVLTVVAMLSVESVFYRPKDKAVQADARKARFHQPEGDHLTLLAVYQGWAAAKFSNAWCFENFVQVRLDTRVRGMMRYWRTSQALSGLIPLETALALTYSRPPSTLTPSSLNNPLPRPLLPHSQARGMKRAQDVRKQLLGIMDRYKLDVVSSGRNFKLVCQAIAAGFFMNAAKKDATEGYRTLVEGQPVYIHPGSALFQQNPEWVLYHELVLTTKEYMRGVMAVDARWLVELAPRFFKPADPTKLSRAKRRVKIEPLYDRFNPADSWRLTKRVG